MKVWPPISIADADPLAIACEPAVVRMGEMLWSAIMRGGLLDQRWWPGWLTGVEHAVDLDARTLWVTMTPVDPALPRWPRRWHADPLTRLLVVQWHRERLALPPEITPSACLAAFRPATVARYADTVNQLAAKAHSAWAMRVPGVVLAYAAGDVSATSISRSRWRSILGLRPRPNCETTSSKAPAGAKRQPSKWVKDIGMAEEWSALGDSTIYATGASYARETKRRAQQLIRALPAPRTGVQESLREWCLYALQDGKGRASRGYALGTMRDYLGELAHLFRKWPRSSPHLAASLALQQWIAGHLEGLASESRDTALKAILSFARFYNRGLRGGVLELCVEDCWDASSVDADLVTPAEYRKALSLLERDANGHELALILILAFRTGLRLDEILGLRVGDFVDAKGGLELVVESNAGRALKTKTSRRILPLDVLLDGDERIRLGKSLEFCRRINSAVGEVWVFGPIALRRVADAAREGPIELALRQASGIKTLRFEHLRHSFASYLLATLLLPQDLTEPALPDALTEVVSPDRFRRVADRFLGAQRLGAGAVHAVSQALGHTGPGTTTTYYCHLLDLVLGTYICRPSTLPPIDEQWLKSKLGVGKDARRKVRGRHRVREMDGDHIAADYVRPTATNIENAAPCVSDRIDDAQLLNAASNRLGRSLRQTIELEEDEFERTKQDRKANERKRDGKPGKPASKLTKKQRSKARPSRRQSEGVPWQVIIPTLDASFSQPDDEIDGRLRQWRRDAARLGSRKLLGARDSDETSSFASLVPNERSLQLYIDDRLAVGEVRSRVEREALLEAVRSMRVRSDIRLRRLGDARAFVRVLLRMGFRPDDIGLSVSSLSGAGISSRELHRFVAGEALPVGHPARRLSGRGGWRGSLVIRLTPKELDGPRQGRRASRFALVMLAIDADLFR